MAPSPQLMVPNTPGMDETRQVVFNALFNNCLMAYRRDPSTEMNCTEIASQAMDHQAQTNLHDCCNFTIPLNLLFWSALSLFLLFYINKLEFQVKRLVKDVKKLENHAGISIKTLREKESEYENARHNWEQFEASEENMERGLRYTDAENNAENNDENHGTHDIEKN